MKKVCVFCGARPGDNSIYLETAKSLGEILVKEQIALVYGGADVGMMGAIANAVIKAGGKVTGVITEHLMPLEGHKGIEDFHIVKNMHDRKTMMYEISDAFVMLPGGIGTLEEFFEILTWAQLKFHAKPIGILNTEGFYTKLIEFLHHTSDNEFVNRDQLDLFFVADTPEELVKEFQKRFNLQIIQTT